MVYVAISTAYWCLWSHLVPFLVVGLSSDLLTRLGLQLDTDSQIEIVSLRGTLQLFLSFFDGVLGPSLSTSRVQLLPWRLTNTISLPHEVPPSKGLWDIM